jgi:DNA replication protein DnaC
VEGPRGRSYARRCECRRSGRGEDLLKAARIPRRYASCDFDSFTPRTKLQEMALQMTREFAREYVSRSVREVNEFGLLFTGPPGVGKTHLAVAALRLLVADYGVPGLFADFRDVMKTIQASYDPVSETSESDVLRPLFQAEVLLLDDLGASRMTEWVRDTFGHIVGTRYNDRKVTLITTNISDETGSRAAEKASLTERVGPAVRSRLHEMCQQIPLDGEDYRLDRPQSPRRSRS